MKSATPPCTLHIAVDVELSPAFDSLITPSAGASSTSLFPHLSHCTRVSGARGVNAVAQTVTLALCTEADHGGKAPAHHEKDIYAVLILDAQQVPPLLSTATAHRCPPHPSGIGPFGWYLDAVVDGLCAEADGDANDGEHGAPPQQTSSSPLTGGHATKRVVRLSLVVTPNATAQLDGLNSTNVNATAKEATMLFSAATAWWSTQMGRTRIDSVCGFTEAMQANAAAMQHETQTKVTLDLCATAASPQQAIHMIVALGDKLLKNWSRNVANTTSASSTLDADSYASPTAVAIEDIRPDTQRKCIPTDFHALYTSMLTEVSSFSERKTMAALSAFPTMCHLLEYIDGIAAGQSAKSTLTTVSGTDALAAQGVYSANFGEHRSWNVLNEAIVDALMTEYPRS